MPDDPVEQHGVDDDDDEVEARETDSIGLMPSWTPADVRGPARELRRRDPSTAIDIDFPVVYEEDRTRMIADLTAARVEGVVAHRRLAERVAKELGIEQYDYPSEQHAIAREQPAIPRMPSSEPTLGSGDGLAPRPPDEDGEPVHRADLSGDAAAEFRRQQRSMSSKEAASVLFKEVQRDAAGRAQRVVVAFADGTVRASRVIYGDDGRLVALEPEAEGEREQEE
jgi:hypothetical protein